MTQLRVTELRCDQVLCEKPFTHPDYTRLEQRLLRYMLMRLCQVLESLHWNRNPNAAAQDTFAPAVQDLVEADGRYHRIIPIRPQLLKERQQFVVVGFFGQSRLDADHQGAAAHDKMLFEEMQRHEGLLSYSSLELTNGDYGNCVVFADEVAKNHWGRSQVHHVAVRDLSPSYYHSIRLYNGLIDGPIMENHKLRLTVAKYFDYSQLPPWQASRLLS